MILETVWVVQVLGLLFSLPLVLGLVGVAHRLRPHLWPYLYLVFLYGAASVQTWRALFYAPWLSVLVLIALIVGAIFGLPHLFQVVKLQFRDTILPELKLSNGWSKAVFSLLLTALLMDLLFAAFPGYRYDQYNYHLVTPKLIDAYGVLPAWVGTDHTHFTGSWEYFFTSFRLLISNDLWVQTATTTFTFLSYLVPISGLLWQIAKPTRLLSLWWVGVPALALYIHVELEPVISSKPDFVNVAAAMAIVAAQSLSARERFFFTFFFLVAGLSFKVTWVHAAVAFAVGFLWLWRREFKLSFLTTSFAGAVLGTLCVLPVFYKNVVLFGNPIHPTQAGPLKSFPVTPAFFEYWDFVSGPPRGVANLVKNIIKVPLTHIKYYLPFAPSLLILGYLYFKEKKFNSSSLRRATPWILAWGAYLVVWGILFRFDIFNRFVAVASIFPLFLAVCLLSSLRLSVRVMALVVFLPLVLNGAMEVKLRRMIKAALQNYSEYSISIFSPALQDYREAKLIQAHAEGTLGKNWRDACHIVSTKPSNYYFNTRLTNYDDYAYDYFIHAFGRERYKNCPWAFFKQMKFCYSIATHEREFSQWPSELRAFAEASPTNLATGEYGDLRVRFIAPSELDHLIATTSGCVLEQTESRTPPDSQPTGRGEKP